PRGIIPPDQEKIRAVRVEGVTEPGSEARDGGRSHEPIEPRAKRLDLVAQVMDAGVIVTDDRVMELDNHFLVARVAGAPGADVPPDRAEFLGQPKTAGDAAPSFKFHRTALRISAQTVGAADQHSSAAGAAASASCRAKPGGRPGSGPALGSVRPTWGA